MQRIEAVMNRRIAAQANHPTQACMRQKMTAVLLEHALVRQSTAVIYRNYS